MTEHQQPFAGPDPDAMRTLRAECRRALADGEAAPKDETRPVGEAARRWHDFRQVFLGSPAGKRILARLLNRSGVWQRSHVSGDPMETARREGMRDIGLWVIEILEDDEPPDPPATAAG